MDDNDVSTCLHCYMLKQFSHIHILRLLTADMPCWPRPACEVLNAVHNVVNCRESEYGLNWILFTLSHIFCSPDDTTVQRQIKMITLLLGCFIISFVCAHRQGCFTYLWSSGVSCRGFSSNLKILVRKCRLRTLLHRSVHYTANMSKMKQVWKKRWSITE